jgi:hypothetical protein
MAASHNLEHFALEFTLEFRIEFVSAEGVRDVSFFTSVSYSTDTLMD